MYEPKDLPERPSDEEVADALSVIVAFCMHQGGGLSGTLFRTPGPGLPVEAPTFSFHFDIHDTRVCGGEASHMDNYEQLAPSSESLN